MGSGSSSGNIGNGSGTTQGDQPTQVRLIKIFTKPTGCSVHVGGHWIGKTSPQGLSVPWNQGTISISRFLYKPATRSFDSKPLESDLHIELEPVLPFLALAIAAACILLIAVLGVFLYQPQPKDDGIPPATPLSVRTHPGEVSVYLGREKTPLGKSDAMGKLSIPAPPPGPTSLRFEKDYFAPKTLEFDPLQLGPNDSLKVSLKRIKTDMVVTTEPGLVDVTVNGTHKGTTDNRGSLLVKGIPVGKKLEIVFAKEGHPSLTKRVSADEVDIFRLAPVKLEPVVSKPVATKPVCAKPPTTKPVVTKLPAARPVETKPPPAKPVDTKVGDTEAPSAAPQPPEPQEPTAAEPVKQEELKTKLILDVGVPSVIVSVTHEDGRYVGITNQKGRFGVARLPVGKPIRVRLQKKGWKPKVLDPFVFTTEKPSIKKKITLVREPSAGRSGREHAVEETESAQRPSHGDVEPLEFTIRTNPTEVEVLVGDSERSMGETSQSGYMKLKVKRPGLVTLRFKKRGFKDKTVKFNLSRESARETLQVALEPSGCDLVIRTIPAGVEVLLEDGRSAVTTSRGRLVVRNVPTGERITLTFKKRGYHDLKKTLQVPSLPTHELEPITLKPVVTILNLRTNVPGADVSIKVGSGTWESKTDADGNLTVYGLPMGKPIIVKIEKEGFKKKTLESFVFSTENTIETLPKITLEPVDAIRK